jgi:hypothetical protein
MTYDLSLTVSEEGLDNFYKVSEALHFWSKWSGKSPDLSSGEIEDFLRLQAQTQKLSITEQLDNGIRFIDFRIMYEQDKKVSVEHYIRQNRKDAFCTNSTHPFLIFKWVGMVFHPFYAIPGINRGLSETDS